MQERYFEDISTDEEHTFGPREVTKQEILDFAERYDPQWFHVDENAARESVFAELIASGWHTSSVCMRLFVDGYLSDTAVVGALGIDELRWRNPVYPGDELTIEVSVAEKELWNDQSGRVEFSIVGRKENGKEVLSRTDIVLIERKQGV